MTQFTTPSKTIFFPVYTDEVAIADTRTRLEAQFGEPYLQLPFVYPRIERRSVDGENSEITTLLEKTNPNFQKLQIVGPGNGKHQAAYFFVEYFAKNLDELCYVHFDLHPDCYQESQGDLGFDSGSFVNHIIRLPQVKAAVMFGFMRCWHNNYNPSGEHDRVYTAVHGPVALRDYSFFKGKNIYISIDADCLSGWHGHMMGGNLNYGTMVVNLEGIASVGNIVGIDMFGLCKTKQEFEGYRNEGTDQFYITSTIFELTKDVLNEIKHSEKKGLKLEHGK
jgi:hypothetical protein